MLSKTSCSYNRSWFLPTKRRRIGIIHSLNLRLNLTSACFLLISPHMLCCYLTSWVSERVLCSSYSMDGSVLAIVNIWKNMLYERAQWNLYSMHRSLFTIMNICFECTAIYTHCSTVHMLCYHVTARVSERVPCDYSWHHTVLIVLDFKVSRI